MSAESIQRTYERFASGVDEACALGFGKVYLEEFVREIATDYASTTFLVIEQHVTKEFGIDHVIPSSKIDDLYERIQQLVEDRGVGLVGSITTTYTSFSFPPAEVEAAERLVAQAYRDQLDKLFSSAGMGGRA